MIVNRLSFHVKPGCMDEAVELVKAERERTGLTGKARIYTPSIGPFNALIEDIEFESLSEFEEFWANWWADPHSATFMKRWTDLIESAGSSEIWNVH